MAKRKQRSDKGRKRVRKPDFEITDKGRAAIEFGKVLAAEVVEKAEHEIKESPSDFYEKAEVVEIAPANPPETTHKGPPARQAEHFPTTVYRDGPDGTIQCLECPDGRIPAGWHDNPATCDNNVRGHMPYVEVKADEL